MRQFNFMSRLLAAQPGESPFISLYLDTGANETGKKDFPVFLKKQLNDHAAVIDPESPKYASFAIDRERIEEFVGSVDPSTRGMAIFARSGEEDFFETFEFSVPFSENRFYMFGRPFVFPLVRLIDQNPTFAVVSADTNAAHIYVFKRAERIRREDIQNTKTNRSEVGGWSQMRYQRHIENFHQQHAKEVVEELDKIVRTDRIDRVILAGDEAVIVPLLRAEMSDELQKTVIGSLPLNINTPEHEVFEAARDILAKHEEENDRERITYLNEVNYDEGVGVTGFPETLSALFNGQVQELYLTADPDEIDYRNDDVKLVLREYAPGIDDTVPEANQKELLIDELIRQAASSADRIRFVSDPHLLKTAGGVGAILRYQTKGASSS
jgi:peptide chain release factor subunit 1